MKLSSRRRAALATFVGSGSTTLIAALQSILLLPLYLREIGTEAYGVWLATGEILLWMMAFDCGIPNLMIQRVGVAQAQGKTGDISRHFASCLTILTSAAVFLTALLWFLCPVVAHIFTQQGLHAVDLVGPLRVAAIASGLTLVNYGFQGLARGLQLTALPNVGSVLSTIVGFAVTYLMLIEGFGLQAIAVGLLVRSAGALIGNVAVLLLVDGFKHARHGFRPCASTIRAYLRETPLLLTSGIAYALMTNSQIAIANFILGPAAAVLLSTTRRLADLIKTVLDMASYSTEGGLAHLFGIGDKAKTVRVLREIDERFFMLSFAMLAGYVMVNGPFVELWTGGQFRPFPLLTIFLAMRAFTVTWGYLGVARIRASGAFRLSSAIILGDCCCRLAAMFVAASAWGLIGLAVASTLPSIAFGLLARAKLAAVWGALPKFNPRLAVACAVVTATALSGALLIRSANWVTAISIGVISTAISGAGLFLASRKALQSERVSLRRAA